MAKMQEEMADLSQGVDATMTDMARAAVIEDEEDERPALDLNELFAEDIEVEQKETKQGKKKTARVPWTDQDVAELRLYFSECFKTKTCPSKEQVEAAKKKSAKKGGRLCNRYWHNVVKEISNMNKK